MVKPISTITSIAELVEIPAFSMNLLGERVWYRGQASSSWGLQPSVFRRYSRKAEVSLTQQFRLRANLRYGHCPTLDDGAGWLSLMQHYGLPTRLLDWSESILIAAFFALPKDDATLARAIEDGAEAIKTVVAALKASSIEAGPATIWVLSPTKLNQRYANTRRILQLAQPEVQASLTAAFVEDALVDERVLAVTGVELDLRMLIQQGAFTIHGSNEPLDAVEKAEDFLLRFDIAPEFKLDLSAKLEQIGIRSSSVFPDLDHLAAELRTRIY